MRFRYLVSSYVCLVILLGVSGCESPAGRKILGLNPPGEEEAVSESPGLFRARWWNYYKRGVQYEEKRAWKEAESDMREAIRQRTEDQRRARTYGMHFVDYFPHRELGIILYNQERYEDAGRELEASLRTEKSARAEYYLDCTRKQIILKSGADTRPPEIILSTPADELSRDLTCSVTGIARDDTYVKSVEINGIPARVDVAAREVPFRVNVPLKQGENVVRVVAADITGKVSLEERRVRVDRQGPVLAIDEPLPGSQPRGSVAGLRVKGYAFSESGIREIRVNGAPIPCPQTREVQLDHVVPPGHAALPPGQPSGTLVVEATDEAGNVTRAQIPLGSGVASRKRVLLASLGPPAMLLAQSEGGSAAGAGPLVELRNWTESQTVFFDQIYLEGSVQDEGGLQGVSINGQSVLRKPGKSCFFNYLAELKEGENQFSIEARNAAGGRVEKRISVLRKAQKVRELGARMNVAILPLERKGKPGLNSEGLEDALTDGLFSRNRFGLVERNQLERVLREQKLGSTELADPDAAVRLGKILSAQGVLMGTAVEKENSLEIYVRLVDTETSLLLCAVDVYGEDVDPLLMKRLCAGLVLKLIDEMPLVEGMVVQAKGNRIISDLGMASRIRKGMRTVIFQEEEPIRHPVTGAILGADTKELGYASVRSVQEHMSELELLGKGSADAIQPKQKIITQ